VAPHAGNVEARTEEGTQQALVSRTEEVDRLDGFAFGRARARDLVQCSDSGGEVIQCRQIGEVALIARKQDVSHDLEAVDGLLDGSEFPRGGLVPVFHLPVVPEKRDVIGGGLQTQHEAELVIHFYGAFAVAMLDAGAFDAG
jgi:hypothetical protein